MQYRSYQHIEKLGRDEVEGILNGKCYIQPKIDGTNKKKDLSGLLQWQAGNSPGELFPGRISAGIH